MKASVYVISAIAAGAFAASAIAGEATAPSKVMVTEDLTVAKSLTGAPGDAASGREVFLNRKQGNCLACHKNSDMAAEPFHGEVGPSLDGAGDRWSAEEIRAIVVNPKKVFGDATIMPAFYRDSGFNRNAKNFKGKTILSAEQVEDIIAYVSSLKE